MASNTFEVAIRKRCITVMSARDHQREHKRIRTDAPVSITDLYKQYISTDRLYNDEAGYDDAIAYWLSCYNS